MPAPAVLLPRNAHRSAVAALIASGAAPVWLPPAYDAASGLSVGVPAAEVRAAIGRAAVAHLSRMYTYPADVIPQSLV